MGVAQQCDKVSYNTLAEAHSVIKGMHKDRRKTRSKKRPRTAYICDVCGYIHITSSKMKRYPVPTTEEAHWKEKKDKRSKSKIHNRTFIVRQPYNFKVK